MGGARWRRLGVLIAAPAAAGSLAAQQPAPRPPVPVPVPAVPRETPRPDTSPRDTARAGRGAGLPQRPSRSFPPPDSVIARLLARPGYSSTRYNADSVRLLAGDREIRLQGHALVEREGSILEADSVRYLEERCEIQASGSPRLFDRTGVLVGRGMRYDACNRTGIIERATTDFREGSALWYLRGNLAVDQVENRLYARGSTITSCDLADPHYHFAAREVKWISRRLLVARPAVLYVRDVPILWMPFIFQDLRRGRRSGLIPPQFGLNDIVRNSPRYRRHIANLGYYWAISDYSDAQVTVDWYAQQFVTLSGQLRYRWLDRFLAGSLGYQEIREVGGNRSRRVSWSHQQDFSLASRLVASIDYASSARVVSRNAVDPLDATATIDSRLNFTRAFGWGTLGMGGNRSQRLDEPTVQLNFPTIVLTPKAIAVSRRVTWSPGFSLTNNVLSDAAGGGFLYRAPGEVPAAAGAGGAGDSVALLVDSRTTAIEVGTPLRIGRWNWPNVVRIQDTWTNRRATLTLTDPADSTLTIRRTYVEAFETTVDWNTGISLPNLFMGTWNLQPSLGIVNAGSGAMMVRNRFTGGRFVSQGKRLSFGAGISPTIFGLFGGVGPVARFRHLVSPNLTWSYAPSAEVPEAYARALSPDGRLNDPSRLRSPAQHTVSFQLFQNVEAKLRPRASAEGDSSASPPSGEEAEVRKLKIVSIQSGAITYDFEQAKRGRLRGWVTNAWSNTFSSDLLPGFSLSAIHDLFTNHGTDSARFDPFLRHVSARFSFTAATARSLTALLGLGGARGRPAPPDTARADTTREELPLGFRGSDAYRRGPTTRQTLDRAGGGAGFSGSFSFDAQRVRPVVAATETGTSGAASAAAPGAPRGSQTATASIRFKPTAHWSLSWDTQYNFTTSRFGTHVVRLDRDMHDWRATFSFVQSPNGNVVFNFFIQLLDQPDIKFEYDQRDIRRP